MAQHVMFLLTASAAVAGVAAQGTRYGYNHVKVTKDSAAIEARAFPEPNATLYAPAFLPNATFLPGWEEGIAGATGMDDMIQFLKGLAAKNAWAQAKMADFVSEEGAPFPYVHLSSNSSQTEKVRVWIQGSAHGNEPAGDQAVLAFLGAMDADPTWAASVLEKVEIVALPRYNPDGNAYFQRRLATNFDPNRDHVKLSRQQTRDIKQWFSSFSPHIALDMHEYSGATRYAEHYVNGADGMYSAAKNLNIHSSIRELAETVFAPAINASLVEKGMRGEPYVTASSRANPVRFDEAGTDGKIGRNAMGLTQCVTFLTETRGIGLANQSFKRRTAAGLQMLLGVVNTARDRSEEVISTISSGIESFKAQDSLVVTDYSTVSSRTFTAVDTRDGSLHQISVEFASTTPATANLTRARPEAYLIPRAWADLAERLRISGVEVKTLDEPFKGEVETYNITASSLAQRYYEGNVLNEVLTETIKTEVSLPKGSFWVSTKQKNAALAFVALEPENIDSYVSFGLLPLEVGDVYPVFRKM